MATLQAPTTSKLPTAVDKSQIPMELSVEQNPIDVTSILALKPKEMITFNYGDYIPNANAFNTFLEANVNPGETKRYTRNRVIQLIKQLAMDLNSGGLNSLAMVCLNKECSRYADCTIVRSGETPPVGESCPLERTEALNHVRGLSADFGEGRTYADQLMIQGIAGIEMLKTRVYASMSSLPDTVIDVEKGIDPITNKVIKDKIENPNFKILAGLLKNEQLLLKGLHLTQEQRVKLSSTEVKTADVLIAELKGNLQELTRAHKANNLEVIDVKVTDSDTKETYEQLPQDTVYTELNGGGKGKPVGFPGGEGRVEKVTGDISKSLGDIRTTGSDFRAVKPGHTGHSLKSDLSKPAYLRGSPFGKDPLAGPDANSMDEVF